jgi:hypothetical protein
MHILHDIGPNDGVQVGLHEVEYQIDIFIIFCLQDIQQRHDVRMPVQLLQEDHLGYTSLYLSVSSLRISSILKGIEYLLQCHYLLCLLIHRLPNHPVRSFPQLLEDLELF